MKPELPSAPDITPINPTQHHLLPAWLIRITVASLGTLHKASQIVRRHARPDPLPSHRSLSPYRGDRMRMHTQYAGSHHRQATQKHANLKISSLGFTTLISVMTGSKKAGGVNLRLRESERVRLAQKNVR